MREKILREIRRLARENDGRAPGHKIFVRETNIAEHHWRGKFWARWGDALIEAGFPPNEWTGRLDSEAVLTGVVAACRHFGRLPTQAEMKMYRNSDQSVPTDQVLRRDFGTKADLIAALVKRAGDDAAYADITAMLPILPPKISEQPIRLAKTSESSVYLIQSGEFFKIGRSDDIERRIKEICIALPDKATLVHVIPTDDPSGIEAYWHQRFKDRRANGEWFKLAATDVAAFRKRKYQ